MVPKKFLSLEIGGRRRGGGFKMRALCAEHLVCGTASAIADEACLPDSLYTWSFRAMASPAGSSRNSYYLVSDGGDQYYVNAVTRQSVWELPWGGKVIGRVDAQDPTNAGSASASSRSLSPRSASPALVRSAAVPTSTPPPAEIATFVASAVALAESRLRDACAAAIASAATANEEKLTRTVTDMCHAAFAEMSEAIMASVTEAEARMLERTTELVQTAEARTDGRVMASIAAAIRDSEARIDARVVRAFSGISEALNARATAPSPAHPSFPSNAAAYYSSASLATEHLLPAPAYASTGDPVKWTPATPQFSRPSGGGGVVGAALSPALSSITTIERRALAGLSLEGLLAVVAMLGGRAALEGRTTASVKNAVLRMTGDTASSVCALLRARDGFSSGLIGVATVFVSHAYDAPFLDVIDAISAWEANAVDALGGGPTAGAAFAGLSSSSAAARGGNSRPHIYFFDLFVINLHGMPPLIPFESLRTDFIGGIRSINNTLLVLDASAPGALSRLWCLFEIAATLAAGGRFDVVLPPRTSADFTATVLNDFEGLVRRMSVIDSERAAAHDLNDASNLARTIGEEMGGFSRVNDLVRGGVRDWLTRAGRNVLRAMEENARPTSALQKAITLLLLERGARDEAEPLLRSTLAGWRGALGDAHPTTQKAAEEFASFLTAGGRLSDASAVRSFIATSQVTAAGGAAPEGVRGGGAPQSSTALYIESPAPPAAAVSSAAGTGLAPKMVSFGDSTTVTQLPADADGTQQASATLQRTASSRRPPGVPPPDAISTPTAAAPSVDPAPLVRSASSRRPPGMPPPEAIIGTAVAVTEPAAPAAPVEPPPLTFRRWQRCPRRRWQRCPRRRRQTLPQRRRPQLRRLPYPTMLPSSLGRVADAHRDRRPQRLLSLRSQRLRLRLLQVRVRLRRKGRRDPRRRRRY